MTPSRTLAARVAALGWGSASARSLDEFADGRTPWTGRSHVNAFYIDRATRQVDRYLASLRRAYPTLAHTTTIFFGGLTGNVAFQTADGPLVRWAYRDSSLRSYYLSDEHLETIAARAEALRHQASGQAVPETERV